MPRPIEDNDNSSFAVLMDDHAASATDFDALFELLHAQYFPRCVFERIQLSEPKNQSIFEYPRNSRLRGKPRQTYDRLQSIATKSETDLHPPVDKSLAPSYDLPTSPRTFIPDRAKHVLQTKKAYVMLVPNEPKVKNKHDDDVEPCDEDLTRAPRIPKAKKPTIQCKIHRKGQLRLDPETIANI